MKTKENLLHLLKILFVMAAVLLLMLPVRARADDATGNEGGTVESEEYGMTMSKFVRVKEDGTYIIDLDAFATGQVVTTVETAPADIILVLDVSGSMADHMYSYTARASQAYTYNNYGSSQYYYLHTDGNYYQVSRGGSSSSRRCLRYTVNNTTWYLSGTGSTTTETRFNGDNTTIYTGVLYERTDDGTKMAALQSAVKGFLDIVAEKNAAPEVANDTNKQSRVAIVKFAGDSRNGTTYSNYQSNIGNQTYGNYNYNYTQVVKDLALVNSSNLGQNDSTGTTTWKGTVNALTAAGATAADYGMSYAQAIYDKHPLTETDVANGRSRVVVMFTDGEPNHQNGFWGDVAATTVNSAKTMKDNGVTVFTVAVLAGADPSLDPTASSTSNVNKYLHAVSSNYKTATATSSGSGTSATFSVTWGERTKNEDGTNKNHYFTATNSSQLAGIFAAIAHSSGSSGSTVSATAVLKDIVSSSFTLPEGATTADIHVSIVRWNSYTHKWGTEADTTGGPYVFTPEQWKTASTTYGAEAQENVAIQIDGANVNVTGFDYSTHYKATKASEDNDVVDTVGGVNKYTAKVVISFPIQARPSAVTGGKVATNGDKSGLYVDDKLIIQFPQPDVVFTPVTYVVDYVTSDTSTDTKASSVRLEYDKVLKNVEMLDDPSDDVLIGEYAADFEYTIYEGRYGTISFGDDQFDVQRRYVRYAPTTMNWDGYDRIFVKGASATQDNKDVWAMLCVLPANSVFYEDTYISQTKTVSYGDQDGDPETSDPYVVDIVYTGINYDSSWSTVGTEGKNQTYHVGDEMGWIVGLADDYDYANDMAHKASTAKAKATFTFSGTGVDIYSRTNGATGTVAVSVKSAADKNESGKKVTKTKNIDTKAAAGDFFAIPVCTFTDLPYGEYTATITVTTGGQAEGRLTFYLDGIRVYNPIKPLEGDGNVVQMYGEKNMGAVFTEVRSLLGTGTTATALYIDEHTVSETVTDVQAIEAAAQALAEAQENRDKYVEEKITPAKNAVSAEEYALSKAKDAVDSAQNVYDAAKAAAEAEPDNEELQNAYAEAETKLAEAQSALTTAQQHYNDTIGGLNDALAAAIAGRAPKDAAVNEAREAYDVANDGVTLEYTTTVVDEYKKEGPKSEVLLDAGQQVAISVESGKTYYIGLRSLNGDEVTALINGTPVEFAHTVDLYYECTPSSGTTIVIKNNSTSEAGGNDKILSVTKLRTTGTGNTTSGTKAAPVEETMTYVRSLNAKFASEGASSYTGEILTEEEAAAEEEAVTEELLDENNVVIENPEPVNTVSAEVEPVKTEPVTTDPVYSKMSRILSSFARFVSRR